MSKYDRIRELGRGGFGTVWLARDTGLGRDVALKVLSGAEPDDVTRFQREAMLAAGLSHPNIASVYEVGEDAGGHFIAMEYVEGETLARVRLTPRESMEAIRDAARAVEYAHGKGIVHRDLKPQNLMRGHDGRVTVLDFGLARSTRAGSSLTRTGDLLGTPAYMSPEQALGRAADARSDVYGLGATLYELVTGVKPFESESLIEVIRRVAWEDPPSPRRINPRLDRDIDTLVMKAMEKDPKRRYATAGELADDLDRALAGEPILAHPPSTLYRLAKRARKHRVAVVAGGIIAALLIGFGAHAAVQARRAAERERALQELSVLWNEVMLAKEGIYKGHYRPETIRAELGGALARVDAYLARHPDHPQAYYVRARARLYLNDLSGAEADLAEAVRRAPDFSPAWSLLGRVRIQQWSLQNTYPEGWAWRPRDADRTLLERARQALSRGMADADRRLERWGLITTQEERVADRVARALEAYYVREDRMAAVEMMEEALDAQPSEEYYNWLGVWLQGDPQTALEMHGRAVDIAPNWAPAYADRAGALWALGRRAEAVDDYRRAVEIDPRYSMAWNNLCAALADAGRAAEAREALDHAMALDPGNAYLWFNRGNLLEGEAAIRAYDRALALDPTFAEAYVNRADARLDLGDADGALADYERAIGANASLPLSYYNRALLLEDRGELDRAVADYTRAHELDSSMLSAVYNRAVLHERRGDLEAAAADFRAVAERGRPDWEFTAEAARLWRALEEKLRDGDF